MATVHKSDSNLMSNSIKARCGLPDNSFLPGTQHWSTKKWTEVTCNKCLKKAPKR